MGDASLVAPLKHWHLLQGVCIPSAPVGVPAHLSTHAGMMHESL
jgi:hypothetical protein